MALRVAIFPYIPDLARDKLEGLRQYIVSEFRKEHGETIQVDSSINPYNLKQMTSTHLGTGKEAYDVMEVDTILLGELVKSKKLQPLNDYFKVTKDEYALSAVHSVHVNQDCDHVPSNVLYGVPTLQCANFLMELCDTDHPPKVPLLKDWTSFEQLKRALDTAEDSRHKIFLAGDFRGSWGLPMFYLDAYVDNHGLNSVYEGIDAPIDDKKLIEDLKHFTLYGVRPGGKNPDTDGTFHAHPDQMIEEVTDSEHILMYSYSENLGEVLQHSTEKEKSKEALSIVSPALGESNFLLTYTDAVIVNKSAFAEKADLIKKFITFYTSLRFRTNFAFGQDMPPSVKYPRYVLPARKDFFTLTKVADDPYYPKFHEALKHSVAAPNHGIYYKRELLQAELQKALGMTQNQHSQMKETAVAT